ncbi:OmpA family protein [Cellulophaga sp. BC115SP]|nr:OmpA family protein [Cellulophaga sp. BC115SP]
MEKAVGVIRVNAIDAETKKNVKKVNYIVRNTDTEELQKYLAISTEGLVYLNLFDTPLKYELEISAKGYEPQTIKLDSTSLDRVLNYMLTPVKKASVVIPLVAQDQLTKDLIPVFEVVSTNLKLTETMPYKVLLVDGDEIDVELSAKEYVRYSKHFVVTDTLLNLAKLIVPLERKSYTFLLKSWEDQELTEHIQASYKVFDLETNTLLPLAFQGLFPMVELHPFKEYSVHVVANGYEPVIMRFAPLNFIKSKQFSKDFILKKKKVVPKAEPNIVIQSKEFGVIEKGKAITLRNLYFDQSSPVLRKESFQELDSLVNLLRDNPSLKLEIRGHTDNVGDFNLNLKLSQDRCQSVIGYLITKGIQADRLKAVGRGPLDPVVPNSTEENKKKNRRVEFIRQ